MGGYPNDISRAQAILRAADALVRALSTNQVVLVLPVPGQEAAEQLSLSPAVVRNIVSSTAKRTRMEIGLSASTVNSCAESRGFDPPSALFDAALGILHGQKLLRIENVEWDSFGGVPYLYRISVSE